MKPMPKSALIVIVALSLCSCDTSNTSQPFQITDTLKYVVQMQFNDAGSHSVWQQSDGTIRSTFEFNDRGRGPEIDSKIELDENGYIVSLENIGKSYMKGTVNESFRMKDGLASWENTAESYTDVTTRGFYLSYNSVPFETSFLIKAIVSSENGKVNGLPGGTLTASRITSTDLENLGSVDLYAINGIDFTPTYVWVDSDLKLFATVSGWMTVIRIEYKDQIDNLIEIQRPFEDRFYTDLAKELTKEPSGNLILKNGDVFEPATGQLYTNTSVVIAGNKIIEVGLWEDLKNSEGEIIDVSGKTLMPGLWDMHGHLGDLDGLLNIAAGVTSARDLANNPYELPSLAKAFEMEHKIGPRVMMAGFVDGTGPFQGPISREFLASSLSEGIDVIDRYDSLGGYEQIKMYSSITPEWVKPMAERAHEKGFRVSGHIPAFMTAEQAIQAGYDEIQHINMLFLNFLGDTLDTRSPVRFTAVAEYGSQLDFGSKEFTDFMTLLRTRKIVVDPTVSIFEGMFVSRPKSPDPAFADVIDRLPVNARRNFLEGGLEVDEEKDQLHLQTFDKALKMISELYKAKVTIVAGTDNLAGFTLHRELENYVKAGIPEKEVLRLATLGSAEVMNRSEIVGTIKPGYLADLIVIDGNPIENISNIRRVETTIKNGKVYPTEAIYKSIGVKHFK